MSSHTIKPKIKNVFSETARDYKEKSNSFGAVIGACASVGTTFLEGCFNVLSQSDDGDINEAWRSDSLPISRLTFRCSKFVGTIACGVILSVPYSIHVAANLITRRKTIVSMNEIKSILDCLNEDQINSLINNINNEYKKSSNQSKNSKELLLELKNSSIGFNEKKRLLKNYLNNDDNIGKKLYRLIIEFIMRDQRAAGTFVVGMKKDKKLNPEIVGIIASFVIARSRLIRG